MKNKFIVPLMALALTTILSGCRERAQEPAITGYTEKEAIENIFTRKSVRSYHDRAVEREKIELIVRAGMAAPSGSDRRPWEIVVMEDSQAMAKLAEGLPYAKMLQEAPLAIIVCGNRERSANWYLDCSAVTQNILLAVEALDLGAVWTGAYPYEDRMQAVSSVLGLPENIIPLAVIPVGYPAGEEVAKDKYDESKIHWNKW